VILSPGLRRLVLTAHVASSVGWLGAAVAFLALTVAGLTGQDAQMLRAVYLAAEPITLFVIVPFAIASLITGVVASLGTSWGLFRHYWVVFKLVLTVLATIVLLQYIETVRHFADTAAGAGPVDVSGLRSYLLHAGGGLLVLLVTVVLAVYKPRGLTPYGWRRQQEQGRVSQP